MDEGMVSKVGWKDLGKSVGFEEEIKRDQNKPCLLVFFNRHQTELLLR